MKKSEMSKTTFIPWNSQDLSEWTKLYATGETISLDGHITHFMKKGDGPPLILIHGFFSGSLVWRQNIDELAKHFTVLAPDLWGLGFSSREPLNYGWKLYSNQIKLFMDAMAISKSHVAGLSMGGGVAIQFTNDFPDRVDKLVVQGPAVLPQKKKIKDNLLAWPVLGPYLLNLSGDTIRKKVMKEKFYSDARFITDEAYWASTWHHKIKGTTESMHSMLRAGFLGNLRDGVVELAEKNKDILILWGSKDNTISVEGANEMQGILEGSAVEIFENAGHVPNVEDPEAFNRKVVHFLLS